MSVGAFFYLTVARYNVSMLTRRSVVSTIYRHWLTVAFLGGFVTDLILLNQIDSLVDNLILLFHATTATLSLLLFYAAITERLPGVFNRILRWLSPALMQYSFGGLLSGMLIFYGRSGDWITSAPFLLLILAVMFGNELIKKRSERLLYHILLYSIGMMSYIVLVVPVVTGVMGDWVFAGSVILAVLLIASVVQVLLRIAPHFIMLSMRRIVFTIGLVYVGFNAFYYFNIIPPIPLSLTALEIAHDAARVEGGYRLQIEEPTWLDYVPFVSRTITPTQGSIACFARVYAPTRLSTIIYHRWEYKDADGKWQTHPPRISYAITGENRGGYGGFTMIQNFFDGTWRCSVETARGQVLGRRTFVVDSTIQAPRVLTVER